MMYWCIFQCNNVSNSNVKPIDDSVEVKLGSAVLYLKFKHCLLLSQQNETNLGRRLNTTNTRALTLSTWQPSVPPPGTVDDWLPPIFVVLRNTQHVPHWVEVGSETLPMATDGRGPQSTMADVGSQRNAFPGKALVERHDATTIVQASCLAVLHRYNWCRSTSRPKVSRVCSTDLLLKPSYINFL